MNETRIGEQFEAVIWLREDGKLGSDFDWLNGSQAAWFVAPGQKLRIKGEIKTEDGYLITDVDFVGDANGEADSEQCT